MQCTCMSTYASLPIRPSACRSACRLARESVRLPAGPSVWAGAVRASAVWAARVFLCYGCCFRCCFCLYSRSCCCCRRRCCCGCRNCYYCTSLFALRRLCRQPLSFASRASAEAETVSLPIICLHEDPNKGVVMPQSRWPAGPKEGWRQRRGRRPFVAMPRSCACSGSCLAIGALCLVYATASA